MTTIKTKWGEAKVIGNRNITCIPKRKGFDIAGYMVYYDKQNYLGKVNVMEPCYITNDSIRASADAHIGGDYDTVKIFSR